MMYAGINLGNLLDAPSGEGSWRNGKVSEEYIKSLKNAGFNTVRIPCAGLPTLLTVLQILLTPLIPIGFIV